MVHSSLSRIGNVVGGPQAVVESLIDVVTDDGTLVMPCFNSAERVIRDFKQGKILDLRESSSGTGIVTETFRTFPHVHRSSHPFSSSCAWGKQAEYITANHADYSKVCHQTSPIARVLELKGKIVGIGISIAQGLGIAHYIEDTYDGFPFEVHSDPIELTYIDPAGIRVTRSISRYDPKVARTRVDYPEGAWIEKHLTRHLERVGILERFKFGEADSWIMGVESLYHELIRLADKGVTMYLTEDDLTDANRNYNNW
jgi:aminoglycoside N3'-acetyltransferase